MKRILTLLTLLVTVTKIHAQSDKATVVNPEQLPFELQIDLIEQRQYSRNHTRDTVVYLHYTVRNVTEDTLVYITNSCFYYNHCLLFLGANSYDLNLKGGCLMNAEEPHTLAPGTTFERIEWIATPNLFPLKEGTQSGKVVIWLTQRDERSWRVNGINSVSAKKELIYEGPINILHTHHDYR